MDEKQVGMGSRLLGAAAPAPHGGSVGLPACCSFTLMVAAHPAPMDLLMILHTHSLALPAAAHLPAAAAHLPASAGHVPLLTWLPPLPTGCCSSCCCSPWLQGEAPIFRIIENLPSLGLFGGKSRTRTLRGDSVEDCMYWAAAIRDAIASTSGR